jgi:hypothetical protein
MSPAIIFSLQLVLGYVAWLLCFGVYIMPRLKAMDRIAAHRAIATLNSFRFFGLVFILPGVVGPHLPASFATFAAYGDFATGVLAMLALLTVRIRAAASRPGRPALGEDMPIWDVLAGVLAAPLCDHVEDAGDLHAEDERQARSLRRPRSMDAPSLVQSPAIRDRSTRQCPLRLLARMGDVSCADKFLPGMGDRIKGLPRAFRTIEGGYDIRVESLEQMFALRDGRARDSDLVENMVKC